MFIVLFVYSNCSFLIDTDPQMHVFCDGKTGNETLFYFIDSFKSIQNCLIF